MAILSQAEEELSPSNLGPEYVGFDHITWYVGNAKQAASYYITRLGFEHVAYRGPETGSRNIVSYVVANHGATFVLTSPVRTPSETEGAVSECDEKPFLAEIHAHLTKHGDGVKDVAFRIHGDVESIWKRAIGNGATSITAPQILADGDSGSISVATVGAYGDTTHTLISRQHYSGPFLPGYKAVVEEDPINRLLPQIDFIEIDHCVGNQPSNGVGSIVR